MLWLGENMVSSFGFEATILGPCQNVLEMYISFFSCSSFDPKLLLSKVLVYANVCLNYFVLGAFFFLIDLICYIYMVSYVVCGFHGTEAKFTSFWQAWGCFLKVAIVYDLLLLLQSGTCEILHTDFCNRRQLVTGRWGKWDIPDEENTQRVSDLRWFVGLFKAAASQRTDFLCKCLAQEALKLYCFGHVHKVPMATKYDLVSLFQWHNLPISTRDHGL